MCVSSALADFTGTTVMLNHTVHPEHGEIFVVGYQNTAVNKAAGPNAMFLHFPSRFPMTQANFVDTSRCRRILKDMVDAVKPRYRSATLSATRGGGAKALIFEHDIYTVVLAGDARAIPEVLNQVPANKRPRVNQELCDFYARHFPDWPVALCCFDNRDAAQAAPLLMWYTPLDTDVLHLPALDCHTGRTPDLRARVWTDHWVIASSPHLTEGHTVHYRDEVPAEVQPFLPEQVIGWQFDRPMPNGDFGVRQALLQRGLRASPDYVLRLPPPA